MNGSDETMLLVGGDGSLGGKDRDYFRQNRDEMIAFIPSDVGKILDVGCAEGSFGKAMKLSKNIEVWGCELCPDVARIAKQCLDTVIVGDIESGEVSFPKNYFDCIVFNDVLEHLRDPWAVLCKLRDNLKPSGYVVASIPNIRHYPVIKELLFHKEWRYGKSGVLDITHFRFFTQKSIVSMFERSGYDVLQCEGIREEKFPWKLGLFNRFLLNALDDMRYERFACVAKKCTHKANS